MSQPLPYQVIDAFADTPFVGNSAGVILDADSLAADQMQAIAREINCSETAFVSGRNEPSRTPTVRWFTPTLEVGFCGHATLAAAHAMATERPTAGNEPPRVRFDSAAGPLRLTAERIPARNSGLLWWLEMPDPAIRPDHTNPMKTCELLGTHLDALDPAIPWFRTRDNDVIVWLKSWSILQGLRPNLFALADWSMRHHVRGWCVATRATLSDSIQVCSRFFAPAAGVAEDPVTGSVHGGIAAVLLRQVLLLTVDGHLAINCVQGQPGGRTGFVRIAAEPGDVRHAIRVGGGCHATLRGEILQIPGFEPPAVVTQAVAAIESAPGIRAAGSSTVRLESAN